MILNNKFLKVTAALFLITFVNSFAAIGFAKEEKAAEESITPEPIETGISRTPRTIFFPKGNLFPPLIADLKEPRFSASLIYYEPEAKGYLAGAAAFGERFHIFRFSPFAENEGFQVSIDGGVVSLFNFQSSSIYLINADYYGGLPISFRHKQWSIRLRPYHQSAHLGDEFVLSTTVARVNLSYEAMSLLTSYEWGGFRLYGGGEFIMRREPSTLDRWIIQGGAEWLGSEPLFGRAYPLLALDIKSYEEHDFFVNTSAKFGVNFRRAGKRSRTERNLSLNMEGFYGHSPFGQFYEEKVFFAGLGASFGF